jgi:protease-4
MLIIRARLPRVRDKIAVVELFGSIGNQIKSQSYERVFSAINQDHNVKAMVLDIDSPGGAVPASDYIYQAVARIGERIPVVACVRGVGASGSYMISCGAQKIVATPGAIIGSIGVISVRPALQELLQRMGVGVTVNKSGPFKDMGAPWRESTPEEDAKMQELIDDSYATFVQVVAKARSMSEEDVRKIATGEVYWAPKAKEIGLIDELGDLDRAIDIAAELSGAPRKPVWMRPKRSLREMLMNPAAEAMVDTFMNAVESRYGVGSLR